MSDSAWSNEVWVTTDAIDKMLIHTVWQSWAPVPATQQSWISDPAIAIRKGGGRDGTPFMDRDENRFPFIGLKQ